MFSFRQVRSWGIPAALFAILYLTGLHTLAISQAQRLLQASGVIPAAVPAAGLPGSTGQVAPASGTGLQMVDLKGRPASLESLRGKVVFLNIWATWCAPCLAEMPGIQSLYDKVKGDKIAFVLLSVDQAGLEKVKKFIDRKGYTFPVYLATGQLPEEFDTGALPTTFVISRAGKIVKTQEGMAEYDTPAFRQYLRDLAK
ncbi:MAG: redoxin family protein [Adhaeribacter sp.]